MLQLATGHTWDLAYVTDCMCVINANIEQLSCSFLEYNNFNKYIY